MNIYLPVSLSSLDRKQLKGKDSLLIQHVFIECAPNVPLGARDRMVTMLKSLTTSWNGMGNPLSFNCVPTVQASARRAGATQLMSK